jgi:hypothetical protein
MAYSFEKRFITKIFRNIIRLLFDGDSHQVVKITVLYSRISLPQMDGVLTEICAIQQFSAFIFPN